MTDKVIENPRHQAKPLDPDDNIQVEIAKRRGNAIGVPKKYTSPATKARQSAALAEGLAKVRRTEGREKNTYRQTLAEHVRLIGDEEVELGDGTKWKRIDIVIRRLFAEAASGKTAAADLLFERGWGKVPAPVEVDLKSEVLHIIEQSGLSLDEAARDMVLGPIARQAGLVIEGSYYELPESEEQNADDRPVDTPAELDSGGS